MGQYAEDGQFALLAPDGQQIRLAEGESTERLLSGNPGRPKAGRH